MLSRATFFMAKLNSCDLLFDSSKKTLLTLVLMFSSCVEKCGQDRVSVGPQMPPLVRDYKTHDKYL